MTRIPPVSNVHRPEVGVLIPLSARRRTWQWVAWLTTLGIAGAVGSVAAMTTNVHWKVEAGVREAFDSNVYLQDVAPDPRVPGAVPAKKGSFVTTLSPRLFADYAPCDYFKAALSYTPDFNWYHDAHSEDNFAHHWGVNLGGKAGRTVWDTKNSFTYIDGSTEGPIFGHPGDCPAVGGIPLRNRRAAFVYLGGFQLSQTFGRWLVRPVASAYVHDFKTQLRAAPVPGGLYENYIDRQDVNGGLDVGYEAAKDFWLLLGYRYGRQNQFRGPYKGQIVKSPYDNTYHRILLGAEGSPLPWLKLAVLAGPDIRQFSEIARLEQMAPAFDRNELLYYVNAAITFLPTRHDSITLYNKRYEQPAFASLSMYEDITYDLSWTHTFNDHWAANTGFRIYGGDWQAPANREDWIFTPRAGVIYTRDKHLSAELTYSYDWAENKVPLSNAPYGEGREFTRHLVSLAVTCAF